MVHHVLLVEGGHGAGRFHHLHLHDSLHRNLLIFDLKEEGERKYRIEEETGKGGLLILSRRIRFIGLLTLEPCHFGELLSTMARLLYITRTNKSRLVRCFVKMCCGRLIKAPVA